MLLILRWLSTRCPRCRRVASAYDGLAESWVHRMIGECAHDVGLNFGRAPIIAIERPVLEETTQHHSEGRVLTCGNKGAFP